MLGNKRLNLIGQLLLALAAFAWGTSFLILKETINDNPPIFIIGVRFFISSVLLGLVFIKKVIKIDKVNLKNGAILGVVLFFAYLLQTYGLKYTTPSRNAFLTASYCVMCPFIMWIFYRKRPKTYHIVSAVLCLIGVGLTAITNNTETGENLFLGDALSVCCAVFYAYQIVFINRHEKESDPIKLVLIEMFTVGVLLLLFSLFAELPRYGVKSYVLKGQMLYNLIYLTLVCTLFTQIAQMVGQKYATPTQTSIILSLEGVFGTLFSIIVGDEKMTVTLIIGFVLIFVAMLISELKPDFKKIFKKKADKEISGNPDSEPDPGENI